MPVQGWPLPYLKHNYISYTKINSGAITVRCPVGNGFFPLSLNGGGGGGDAERSSSSHVKNDGSYTSAPHVCPYGVYGEEIYLILPHWSLKEDELCLFVVNALANWLVVKSVDSLDRNTSHPYNAVYVLVFFICSIIK